MEHDMTEQENFSPDSSTGTPENMPEPVLPHILQTFYLQAMISLGKYPNPVTRKFEHDLKAAKYYIGLLEVLEGKTRGNLSDEEKGLLDEFLHTARLAYVDESKMEKKD